MNAPMAMTPAANTARRNPMDAAMAKGRAAALAGEPESACPYKDKRVPSGRLSFSRAWINAWVHGHRMALREGATT
jgi:hypothetical protein